MTSADYQKRLSKLVPHSEYCSYIYDDKLPCDCAAHNTAQALTALCRDVCGEVIGENVNFMKQPTLALKDKAIWQNHLRAEQHKTVQAILGQPQEEE